MPNPARPADPARLAASLYPDGPLLTRVIQRHRHRICPLDLLERHVPEGADVLDVGCGGGLLLARLAASGRIRSGHGIDASDPAIDLAQRMLPRLEAINADAALVFEHRPVQDGLPDRLYDAVCLIDVLHHVPPADQRKAFEDAASRVRPGGLFLYKDMCDAPLVMAGMNRLHDLVMARQWIQYVPVEDAEAWARDLGLLEIHREDTRLLWYGHELRVFKRPADDSPAPTMTT